MTINYFTKRWNKIETETERLKWLRRALGFFYLNKQLNAFLEQVLEMFPEKTQKQQMLNYAKKVVKQDSRCPEGDYFEAFREEFTDMFDFYAEEQKEHDPVVWIDAELEYLNLDVQGSENKNLAGKEINTTLLPVNLHPNLPELLQLKEILILVGISKSTLDRWRATESMPIIKQGKKLFAKKEELLKWIDKRKILPEPNV